MEIISKIQEAVGSPAWALSIVVFSMGVSASLFRATLGENGFVWFGGFCLVVALILTTGFLAMKIPSGNPFLHNSKRNTI